MKYRETILVENPETGEPDRYGNLQQTLGEPVTVRAAVLPLEATEDEINRDTRISRYRFWVPAGDLTGLSSLEWRDRHFEVIGEPQTFTGRSGLHHLQFDAREVRG